MDDKEQSIKTGQIFSNEYLGTELDHRHADGKEFYYTGVDGEIRSLADMNIEYQGPF